MKMKKMLAILSALTMSASICLSVVPAMAEEDDGLTYETVEVESTPDAESEAEDNADGASDADVPTDAENEDAAEGDAPENTETPDDTPAETPAPTEAAPEAGDLDYDTIYTDYINKMVEEKGRAALNADFTQDYNLNQVFGIVSSAIYDFNQDGVKELVVVTREGTEVAEDAIGTNAAFYLNLYQADANGNVVALDKIKTSEEHYVSKTTGSGLDSADIYISGNAIYIESEPSHTADDKDPTHIYRKYAVYDIVNGKFSKYELTVTANAVYDTTNGGTGTVLYADTDISAKYGSSVSGQYATLTALNNAISQKLNSVDFSTVAVNVVTTKKESYLSLKVELESSVKLVNYQFNGSGETPYQRIKAAMVGEPEEPEQTIDYDEVYYDFVYNNLIKELGRATRNVYSFVPDYNTDKLLGVVSSAVHDFDDDGVDELLVVTREELFIDDYSGVYYEDTGDWELYTTFCLYLYQADEEGNVNLLADTMTEDHTVASYPNNWYEDVELGISGNCIYETYTTTKYAEDGTQSLVHEYNFFEIEDNEFVVYKFSTDVNAVWEGYINDDLLYTDDALSESYDTYYSGQAFGDSVDLSNVLTDYLADVTTLDFTYAEVVKSSAPVASFINVPEYMTLDIDIVPDVLLLNYQFSDLDDETTYQTMGASMLGTPLRNTDDDDDSLSSVTSNTTKNAPSTATTGNNNSSDTSTSSPDTSDKLPVAAGFTALAALAAGFFTRRKNK